MLEEEAHGLINGQRKGTMNLSLVEDVGAMRAAQASALDPGRGQEAGWVRAGCEDSRVRGNNPVSLPRCESEREQVVDVGGPTTHVGQDSEVKVCEVGTGLGQVLEGDAPRVAFELCDQCRVRLTGGGAKTHIDTCLWALPGDVVGAPGTEGNVDDEDGLVSEGHQINGGDQLR